MLKPLNISLTLTLFLTSPFRKQKRRQIRMMMRGYRYLKKEGKLHIIEDAIQHLREHQFQIPPNALPSLLWGQAGRSAELIVRQRLSSHYVILTQALLIALSKPNVYVIAPIPKAWRIELQRLGFRIDHLRSLVAWNLYLIKFFCYGIYKTLLVLKGFVLTSEIAPCASEDYIYFCDLAPDNIPLVATDNPSSCIFGWYSRWQGRRHDITSLRHSVPNSRPQSVGSYDLCYQQSPIPALICRVQQVYFFLLLLATLVHTLGSFCKRHWWNIIIYHESIESLLVRLQDTPLAKEYWFHNSRFYPPLWVYELPSKGSKCIYYFYSTNCEPFLTRKDGTLPFITPYSIANWPEYIVWDTYQHQFIRKFCGDRPRVTIVGPICFTAQSVLLPMPMPKRTIAVFDVQPHRSSIYQGLGIASEFYVPNQCISFLEDILSIAMELGVTLLIKKKREIGTRAHQLYRHYVKSIASNENVVLIDPGVSVDLLAKSSLGSISMPFTSTAIISREAGVPSVYYVPSQVLNVDSSLSHGIQVICSINSLRCWMKAVLASHFCP